MPPALLAILLYTLTTSLVASDTSTLRQPESPFKNVQKLFNGDPEVDNQEHEALALQFPPRQRFNARSPTSTMAVGVVISAVTISTSKRMLYATMFDVAQRIARDSRTHRSHRCGSCAAIPRRHQDAAQCPRNLPRPLPTTLTAWSEFLEALHHFTSEDDHVVSANPSPASTPTPLPTLFAPRLASPSPSPA